MQFTAGIFIWFGMISFLLTALSNFCHSKFYAYSTLTRFFGIITIFFSSSLWYWHVVLNCLWRVLCYLSSSKTVHIKTFSLDIKKLEVFVPVYSTVHALGAYWGTSVVSLFIILYWRKDVQCEEEPLLT